MRSTCLGCSAFLFYFATLYGLIVKSTRHTFYISLKKLDICTKSPFIGKVGMMFTLMFTYI